MIKLTNSQSSALLSVPIQRLFNDEDRQFPNTDAFKISDLLTSVQSRMKPYYAQLQKIAKSCGAKIEPSGIITGLDEKGRQEVIDLNNVELEYNFERLTPNKDWPKLSLAESSILRPLVNFNGDGESKDAT